MTLTPSTPDRPLSRRRLLLLSLGALLTVAGCTDTEPKWWCQTEAGAAQDLNGHRKCYRRAEYCEGGCAQTEVAECFDTSPPGIAYAYGGPGDRDCYVDRKTCAEAREYRDRWRQDVHSECRGMTR